MFRQLEFFFADSFHRSFILSFLHHHHVSCFQYSGNFMPSICNLDTSIAIKTVIPVKGASEWVYTWMGVHDTLNIFQWLRIPLEMEQELKWISKLPFTIHNLDWYESESEWGNEGGKNAKIKRALSLELIKKNKTVQGLCWNKTDQIMSVRYHYFFCV